MNARYGDTVKVRYRGRVDEKTVFGTRSDNQPLEITLGQGQVITGFEEAVVGMREGEEKTVQIPMEKAFGRRSEENVVVVDRQRLPVGLSLEKGKRLFVRTDDGRRAVVAVVDILETSVALNANHPLAGKDLTFQIKLLEIVR